MIPRYSRPEMARIWEPETPEAEAFWAKNIEPLDESHQREVITLLPSISEV